MARRVRSAADDLDATGRDKGTDGSPEPSPGRPDSALRTERTVAYHAVVDATYRQYAVDGSDARAETLECGTKGDGQPADAARKSSRATDATTAVARDGSTCAFGHSPATAAGGDGSIGNGGGVKPPAGDTPRDPEGDGDGPECVNGGLGELVSVNAKDRAADLLAERIGGEASVRFANGPANEFDALSTEYVAQAKPANLTLNKAFRDQAKVTFEVALQSGRTPYFQFDGPPGPGVLRALSRYADRYDIEPVIDLTPLGEA
jgi:Restriction endonuclease fold toxin 3